MAHYESFIQWHRAPTEAFVDKKYSRAHTWKFDGGAVVPASSSPHNVRLPFSKAENVDPEEALVAAASSCHMLSFLYYVANEGFVVDSYEDAATAQMGKNAQGHPALVRIELHPVVTFSGANVPTDETLDRLHHIAHENCIIANSINAEVVIKGSWTHA